MLEVVSTVRSPSKAVLQHAGFPTPDDCGGEDEFMVVDDDVNLLDCYIDFTCCDVVPSLFDADGDVLPDLEVDPTEELLAEFEDQTSTVVVSPVAPAACSAAVETKPPPDDDDKEESPGGGSDEEKKDQKKNIGRDNEALMSAATTTTTEDSAAAMEAAAAGSSSSDDSTTKSSASAADKGGEKNKKTKTSSKNSHGGSKKKVDWTPELHRRFVQAVEQLGIDKAVPTRILEIMGIDSLTRHNIASHLQKYRSHRKHLMEREAEAATWAQKRHMRYAAAANTGVQVVPTTTTKDMPAAAGPPWVMPPTIGFPPFGVRPLHVWGHPPPTAVEGMLLPLWPRHLQAPTTRPPAYWHQQQYNNAAAAARKWGPQTVARGAPCVTPPRPPAAGATLPARFPVPGMTTTMPAHPMYRRPIIPPTRTTQSSSSISKTIASLQLQLDAHPSKESIDAAIGDVLVKPWLPLPLGLKPPSLDSVMSELHKQGIPDIPPPARPGHQRQLADPSYGSSIQRSHRRRHHLN